MKTTMITIATALLALASGPAFAQGGMGQGGMGQGSMGQGSMGMGWVMRNCQTEVAQFCGDLKHGSGEIPVCLAKHRDALSPACKTALDNKGPGWGRQNMQPAPVN